ncbi:MAG: glycosyltransferase family 39 protein [Chloroflexia bacterium]
MWTVSRNRIAGLRTLPAGLLVAGVLAVLAAVLYGSLLGGYFLSDDFVILSWTRVSAPGEVLGLFDPRAPWFYRPMLKMVYWALQSIFGLNPLPFHLFNIVMHTLAAWLLYFYAKRVAAARPATALAVSLLFFVNHRHAEPVASISAMGELIAVPALFGSLLLAHRFVESRRPPALAASLGLFAVALLSRESAVLLPVLAALSLALFAPKPLGRRALAALGTGYAALLAAYALLQLQVVNRGGEAGGVLSRGGLSFKPLNAESVVLGVMDYANGLLPGGGAAASLALDQLRPVAWAELGLLLALGGVLALTHLKLMLLGLAWMLVSPLPFVFFNAPTDRYFYMPTIGYSLLLAGLLAEVASGLARLLRRPPSVVVPSALAGAVLVLLLPQVPALSAKEAHWNAAGALSGRVLSSMKAALPNPVRHQAFLFVGLPTDFEGVPTFRNGIVQAVQLEYGNDLTLRAGITTCAEVRRTRPSPPDSVFQFTGSDVRLLADPQSCGLLDKPGGT